MRRVRTTQKNADGSIVYQSDETTGYDRWSKYDGPWEGMMRLSIEGIRELRECLMDHSLGMQALRVLFGMIESVDVHDGNRVRAGRKDLARLLKMTESNVSGAIRQLVDCGFVEKSEYRFGYYVISPRLFWYGKTDDLRAALKARGMLGPDGRMRPRAVA